MHLSTSNNNYLLAGIGFFVLLLALNAILTTDPETDYPGVAHIVPADAYLLIENDDVLLLDVREKGAYKLGHLPNAVAVPVGEIKQRLAEFISHKAKNIIVYCNDGIIRGPKATAILNNAGYTHAKNLRGGLDAWRVNSYQAVIVQ